MKYAGTEGTTIYSDLYRDFVFILPFIWRGVGLGSVGNVESVCYCLPRA